MKKPIFGIVCALLALSARVDAADRIRTDVQRPENVPGFLGNVPDEFLVVLAREAGVLEPRLARNGVPHVGRADFDALSDRFRVSSVRQQFRGASPDDPRQAALARYHKVKFEEGSLEDAMAAWAALPFVERVEPIGIHATYGTPNDPYFSPYQTYHHQASDHDMDSPEAWDVQTGSADVIVAILDTGTRYYHPDLGGVNAGPGNPGAARGNMWINGAELDGSDGVDDDANGYVDDWIGYDFIDGVSRCWPGEDCNGQDNDPRDFNGHGTHTAGVVGMLSNDGYGMAGVAGGWGSGTPAPSGNGSRIMALRMGYSYNWYGLEVGVVMMDAAAEALYYAANNGARIASCSWGSSDTGGIAAAVDYFLGAGGMIFVAAGNDGTETPSYLGGRGDCISVAAVDVDDSEASFTTHGTWVDISAPGVGIYSTYHDHSDPNTNYWAALDGTSMATPLAAGVGALIWSQNPGWTAGQVQARLYESADDIDAYLSPSYLGKMGVGRINAFGAVHSGPPPAPVAAFSGSPTSGTEPLTVSFTDASTGNVTSWSWAFGDGGTSTEQSPSHEYTSAGTYDVSLTVTGPDGSDVESKLGYVTVSPCVPPTASFTATPASGEAPLDVQFTDTSTGSPSSWSWSFGDGGSSTAPNPSYTYAAAGTYTVTMTATNACGSDVVVRTDAVTVSDPPGGPWVTITWDDFEDGLGSYADGGNDMSLYTGGSRAHQGSNAADIQDDNGVASSFFHSSGHDVSGYDELAVDFWYLPWSMEIWEDFWLQYFDGAFWRTVATFTQGVDFQNGEFHHAVVSIPKSNYSYPTNARLRFRCDAGDNSDDVYIDEIRFRGRSTGGGPLPPAAPGTLVATPVSSSRIDLAWSDNSGDEEGFAVERSTDGASFAPIADLPANTVAYADTGLAASTTYWYRVRAYNAAGASAYSDADDATTAGAGVDWVVITYDDFEDGMGSYAVGGDDAYLYSGGTFAHEGSNAAGIQDDNGVASSFFHSSGQDVSSYSDLEVEFWYYTQGLQRWDDFWLQYFDGAFWRTVATFTQGVDFQNDRFQSAVVSIPRGSYGYPTDALLRFRCDAKNNGDDVYIDEIEFRGLTSGAAAPGDDGGVVASRGANLPRELSVRNAPNPFRGETRIDFALPTDSRVEIVVFNVLGQRVATVTERAFTAGLHSVRWNAADSPPGVYFYRIQAGPRIETKRMVLLR